MSKFTCTSRKCAAVLALTALMMVTVFSVVAVAEEVYLEEEISVMAATNHGNALAALNSAISVFLNPASPGYLGRVAGTGTGEPGDFVRSPRHGAATAITNVPTANILSALEMNTLRQWNTTGGHNPSAAQQATRDALPAGFHNTLTRLLVDHYYVAGVTPGTHVSVRGAATAIANAPVTANILSALELNTLRQWNTTGGHNPSVTQQATRDALPAGFHNTLPRLERPLYTSN